MMITQLSNLDQREAQQIAGLAMQLGYSNDIGELIKRIERLLNSEHDCIFVARDRNQIIGWIHVFAAIRIESPLFVEIGGLVVDEYFRKQQIGRQLVIAAEQWAREIGIDTLRVRCNTIRTESHQFYEKTGFQLSKEQKIFERVGVLEN